VWASIDEFAFEEADYFVNTIGELVSTIFNGYSSLAVGDIGSINVCNARHACTLLSWLHYT
jgi:hypothetical protein